MIEELLLKKGIDEEKAAKMECNYENP